MVEVADVLRVLCLVIGLFFAGALFWIVRTGDTPGIAAPGFKWRMIALLIGVLYVCVTEYPRLGDTVSFHLVLGITYLATALYSVWLPIPELREEDPGHKLRDL
jgi:hypothetical protein